MPRGARNLPFDRGAWILGGLVCLVLLASAANRFGSAVDTSAQLDIAIAAAPKAAITPAPAAAIPTASPVFVVSSPLRGAPDSTARVAPQSAQPSATSSGRVTAPAGGGVIVGKLVVTSDPVGASVFMNQRYVGKTPLETSVKAGSYAVVLELDGARWTDVVLVRAERVTRVERQLQDLRIVR